MSDIVERLREPITIYVHDDRNRPVTCSRLGLGLEAADEIERLRLYERAMQSMAAQFVHPKTTAEKLAREILRTDGNYARAWQEAVAEIGRLLVTIQQERDLSQERWRQVREQQAEIEQLRADLAKCRRLLREMSDEVKRLKQWVADLQGGMFVNCVYCGHCYGPSPGTPVAMADVLRKHIEQCPEHPLSAAMKEIERLRDELLSKTEDLAECRRLLRQAVERLDYPEIQNQWGGWVIAARAAGAGDE